MWLPSNDGSMGKLRAFVRVRSYHSRQECSYRVWKKKELAKLSCIISLWRLLEETTGPPRGRADSSLECGWEGNGGKYLPNIVDAPLYKARSSSADGIELTCKRKIADSLSLH